MIQIFLKINIKLGFDTLFFKNLIKIFWYKQ